MCEYNNIEKRREVLLWRQKKIRSKYTKSEMTCITMFYLLKDKELHISTFVDKFELNDKQKMYKIITIIKNALADFCVGYYIKNDRSTATYYLASIDDDG